jgi:hypothetical protein
MVPALILYLVPALVLHSMILALILYLVPALVPLLHGTSSHPLSGTSPGPPLYGTSSHGASPCASSLWVKLSYSLWYHLSSSIW